VGDRFTCDCQKCQFHNTFTKSSISFNKAFELDTDRFLQGCYFERRHSRMFVILKKGMRVFVQRMTILILVCSVSVPVVSQSPTSKYRTGTIMAVTRHDAGSAEKASSRTYDISVKVENTIYVVLYAQPPGTISPQYRTGLELPVLVGRNTFKFNDQLGRSRELPILSRRTIPDTRQQNVHRSPFVTRTPVQI